MSRINFRETVKCTKREDKTSAGGVDYVKFTFPLETPNREDEKDPKSKYVTVWLDVTVFKDKATGQFPGIIPYIQKGGVYELSGQAYPGAYINRDGKAVATFHLKFPHFSFVPKATEEDPYADEPAETPAPAPSAPVAADPWADE